MFLLMIVHLSDRSRFSPIGVPMLFLSPITGGPELTIPGISLWWFLCVWTNMQSWRDAFRIKSKWKTWASSCSYIVACKSRYVLNRLPLASSGLTYCRTRHWAFRSCSRLPRKIWKSHKCMCWEQAFQRQEACRSLKAPSVKILSFVWVLRRWCLSRNQTSYHECI